MDPGSIGPGRPIEPESPLTREELEQMEGIEEALAGIREAAEGALSEEASAEGTLEGKDFVPYSRHAESAPFGSFTPLSIGPLRVPPGAQSNRIKMVEKRADEILRRPESAPLPKQRLLTVDDRQKQAGIREIHGQVLGFLGELGSRTTLEQLNSREFDELRENPLLNEPELRRFKDKLEELAARRDNALELSKMIDTAYESKGNKRQVHTSLMTMDRRLAKTGHQATFALLPVKQQEKLRELNALVEVQVAPDFKEMSLEEKIAFFEQMDKQSYGNEVFALLEDPELSLPGNESLLERANIVAQGRAEAEVDARIFLLETQKEYLTPEEMRQGVNDMKALIERYDIGSFPEVKVRLERGEALVKERAEAEVGARIEYLDAQKDHLTSREFRKGIIKIQTLMQRYGIGDIANTEQKEKYRKLVKKSLEETPPLSERKLRLSTVEETALKGLGTGASIFQRIAAPFKTVGSAVAGGIRRVGRAIGGVFGEVKSYRDTERQLKHLMSNKATYEDLREALPGLKEQHDAGRLNRPQKIQYFRLQTEFNALEMGVKQINLLWEDGFSPDRSSQRDMTYNNLVHRLLTIEDTITSDEFGKSPFPKIVRTHLLPSESVDKLKKMKDESLSRRELSLQTGLSVDMSIATMQEYIQTQDSAVKEMGTWTLGEAREKLAELRYQLHMDGEKKGILPFLSSESRGRMEGIDQEIDALELLARMRKMPENSTLDEVVQAREVMRQEVAERLEEMNQHMGSIDDKEFDLNFIDLDAAVCGLDIKDEVAYMREVLAHGREVFGGFHNIDMKTLRSMYFESQQFIEKPFGNVGTRDLPIGEHHSYVQKDGNVCVIVDQSKPCDYCGDSLTMTEKGSIVNVDATGGSQLSGAVFARLFADRMARELDGMSAEELTAPDAEQKLVASAEEMAQVEPGKVEVGGVEYGLGGEGMKGGSLTMTAVRVVDTGDEKRLVGISVGDTGVFIRSKDGKVRKVNPDPRPPEHQTRDHSGGQISMGLGEKGQVHLERSRGESVVRIDERLQPGDIVMTVSDGMEDCAHREDSPEALIAFLGEADIDWAKADIDQPPFVSDTGRSRLPTIAELKEHFGTEKVSAKLVTPARIGEQCRVYAKLVGAAEEKHGIPTQMRNKDHHFANEVDRRYQGLKEKDGLSPEEREEYQQLSAMRVEHASEMRELQQAHRALSDAGVVPKPDDFSFGGVRV